MAFLFLCLFFLIGCDQSNLSKHLNGKLPISDSFINKVVINMGVSKDWLRDGSDVPFAKYNSSSVPSLMIEESDIKAMKGTPVYNIDVTAGCRMLGIQGINLTAGDGAGNGTHLGIVTAEGCVYGQNDIGNGTGIGAYQTAAGSATVGGQLTVDHTTAQERAFVAACQRADVLSIGTGVAGHIF